MVFSSALFLLVFLPVVVILNFIMKPAYSNVVLLLASIVFYAWGEPVYVILLIISIFINWLFGGLIWRTNNRGKKIALIAGIIINLVILAYYKYAVFFVNTINGFARAAVFPVPDIVLPIGISFFVFKAISYLADIYSGKIEAAPGFMNTALYISFFPQIMSGPITQYSDIGSRLEGRTVNWLNLSSGFKRFIYGLAKKMLVANVLGLCVDSIWAYEFELIDTRTAWIGSLAYTFQIYYDFSGYSDMAIGLGDMLGFSTPENFDYPYLSHSITEFWRRWHSTLGSWFREYVYIPLGGNRKGVKRTYVNLMIVFFLTGLWHGADFSFIIWGIYHGFFSVIERLGLKKILSKSKIISVLYCFMVVNFGWVLFRAENAMMGVRYIIRMIAPWRYTDVGSIPIWSYMDNKTVLAGICAVLGAGLIKTIAPKKFAGLWQDSAAEAIYCIILLMVCLAAVAGNTYNPFIYFKF